MSELVRLRKDLHRCAELSGQEAETAARVRAFFEPLNPDRVIEGLGGHGLAFVYSGADPGPTVMLRCDLDALPILEVNDFPHVSRTPGVGHKCGHDGHMAIMAAVGRVLAERRPAKGRVVLLFQPSEENGKGARAIIEDPRFDEIRPDHVFALHNLPGFSLGEVVIKEGTFCCASAGVIIELEGSTGHAAQPETGCSPAAAMCRILEGLVNLGDIEGAGGEIAFASVIGARLGVKDSFGTTPGSARVLATMRAETNATMAILEDRLELLVSQTASREGLAWQITSTEEFPSTVNSRDAVEAVGRAAMEAPLKRVETPFRWSEDFGHFTARFDGALFGLGAGLDTPALHHQDYDFPDALIGKGMMIFRNLVEEYNG